MPQSEPPGPFIADDEDAAEDLLPALRRGRGLGERALAVSGVILVPLAALAVMRGLSSHERTPSEVPRPAAARVVASRSAAGESESGAEKAERNGQETPAAEAVAIDANHAGAAEQPSARPQTAPPTEKVVREAAQPAVRLAELAPKNTVVDRSNGDVNAGAIDVESTPPSNVILDGRPLGKSPRVVKVAAGPHTLVFIHPLYGRRSLSVNVHSGATTGAAAEF